MSRGKYRNSDCAIRDVSGRLAGVGLGANRGSVGECWTPASWVEARKWRQSPGARKEGEDDPQIKGSTKGAAPNSHHRPCLIQGARCDLLVGEAVRHGSHRPAPRCDFGE